MAGERQVAPTLAGIRRDHVARYEWAAKQLGAGKAVVDVACGVGYGTQLLAQAGLIVAGFDRDAEAIEYAKTHYAHAGADYGVADVATTGNFGRCDAAICFETIEHIADPLPLLKALHETAPLLLASVPNEDVFPWEGYAFHYRHYTPGQFRRLLEAAGWDVIEWWGQEGAESEVLPEDKDRGDRTLIAVARRRQEPRTVEMPPAPPIANRPKHVAILGFGPSVDSYTLMVKRAGGRHKIFDEVWTINALGAVFDCDRIFHMDDVRIQEIRAKAKPDSNIAAMLAWIKTHPGPIYTSRPHPDYPGLVAMPLAEMLNDLKYDYFNSTAAWAVAYAVHVGVEKITVFGNDFTYPNAHDAEKGRACVEFWLGVAAARGIKLQIPQRSSLMDSCVPKPDKLYGYDTVDVSLDRNAEGRIVAAFTERAQLPTADQIEHKYDHSRHPSVLLDPDKKES